MSIARLISEYEQRQIPEKTKSFALNKNDAVVSSGNERKKGCCGGSK